MDKIAYSVLAVPVCVSKVTTSAGRRLPLPFVDKNPSNHRWTGCRVNCRGMVGRSWRWQAGRRKDVAVSHPSTVGSGKGTRQRVCLLDHILPRPPDTIKNQYICNSLAQAADCARSGACVSVHALANVCVFMFVCTYVFIKGRNRVTRLYIGKCFKDVPIRSQHQYRDMQPSPQMTAGLMSASESHFTATLEVSRQRL